MDTNWWQSSLRNIDEQVSGMRVSGMRVSGCLLKFPLPRGQHKIFNLEEQWTSMQCLQVLQG